jgi:hypothetical protein
MKRSFRIIDVLTASGPKKGKENYFDIRATTPSNAARKAATKICGLSEIKGQCTLEIILQEFTRGGNDKQYKYKVKRHVFSPPRVVTIAGKEVSFHSETKVTAM